MPATIFCIFSGLSTYPSPLYIIKMQFKFVTIMYSFIAKSFNMQNYVDEKIFLSGANLFRVEQGPPSYAYFKPSCPRRCRFPNLKKNAFTSSAILDSEIFCILSVLLHTNFNWFGKSCSSSLDRVLNFGA